MKLLPGSESFSDYSSELLPKKSSDLDCLDLSLQCLCCAQQQLPVPGWEQDWQGDGDSAGLPAAGSRSYW